MAELEDEKKSRSRNRAPLHWVVQDLFDLAKARGLSFAQLSQKIKEKTDQAIPEGSLKYWSYGYSSPRIEQVDAIAITLGYEVDLQLVLEKKAS